MSETILNLTESVVRLPIKLAFKELKDNSPIAAKLVGWYTDSNFGHVELIMDDLWISSADGGVHVSKLNIEHNDKWAIVELEDAVITGKQYREILAWLNMQDPAEYDWTGIFFSQFIPLDIDDPNKWFCSEIVTKVLQMLGYRQVIDLDPSDASPGTLAKLFKIE